jgi:hypothetical protein
MPAWSVRTSTQSCRIRCTDDVYDKINKDRLLGYHPRWAGNEPWRNFMAMSPMRVTAAYDPSDLMQCSVDCRRVEFMRYPKIHEDGWRIEVALITDATLQDLMMLRDFRLPGESARAAEERRHIQAYL